MVSIGEAMQQTKVFLPLFDFGLSKGFGQGLTEDAQGYVTFLEHVSRDVDSELVFKENFSIFFFNNERVGALTLVWNKEQSGNRFHAKIKRCIVYKLLQITFSWRQRSLLKLLNGLRAVCPMGKWAERHASGIHEMLSFVFCEYAASQRC